MEKKVLIIGGVAGGASAAARLRRLSEKVEIIVFERGEYISFANCGLPYYIGGVINNRDALILQTPEEFGTNFNLDVRILSEVVEINRESKFVLIKDLKTNETYKETYDELIISTGAYPIKPAISGINEASNLFTVRGIPDVDLIKEYIEEKQVKKAVVVGAGFIGLEMAENLHHIGIDVTIIELANQVMAPVDLEMALIVHEHILEKGANLILEDGVKAFLENGKKVELVSGRIVETDLIIFSIGVRPENVLAEKAGLVLGSKGGIVVNDYLQTNDPSIYAIGDVIEVQDFISKNQTMIPLAGPANKQGRIAANNVMGHQEKYLGTLGTSVAKVFDLVVGATGNSEKTLKATNQEYDVIHIHPTSHASYYPDATPIDMKILYNPKTQFIYGAQAVGETGVDKRIDVIATAIAAKMKVTALKDLELSYAPPFSSAKDPVNMLGFIAENKINGLMNSFQLEEIENLDLTKTWILDVRTDVEYELGSIPNSNNIPLEELRTRINEVPKDKEIYVFCQTGIRSYNSSRILMQAGFRVKNLDGGFKSYQCVYDPKKITGCDTEVTDFGFLKIPKIMKEEQYMSNKVVKIDACGLQCPGPIVQVFKNMETLSEGDVLEVQATDSGFVKDIKKWAEKTNNTLLDLQVDGKVITAKIRKGSLKKEDVVVTNNKENTTIVVFSQDMDKAIAAFIIATGAASMGKEVSLFFTFWGLNILRKPKHVKVKKTFIEKMFGFMMPRGSKKLPISNMNMLGMGPKMIKAIMKKKNVDSLPTLMENAMEMGVKIIACAMSMDIMGIKQEELIDGIEIGGVATYLADTTEANHNLFI